MAAGARQRFVNVLPDDEMRAKQPHRLPRRRAHGRQAEAAHDIVEDGFGRLAGMDDAGGDAERPGRSRDQQRRRFDVAVKPAAGGELVLDQPVRRRRIGHAKERLGQHHQRQPLLGRQRIGVQKIFDAAESGRLAPDRLDQAPRPRIDAALRGAIARGLGEEIRRQFVIGWSEWRLKSRQGSVRPVHRDNLSCPAQRGRGTARKRGGRGLGLHVTQASHVSISLHAVFHPATTTKLRLRGPLHHAARGPPPPLRGGGSNGLGIERSPLSS